MLYVLNEHAPLFASTLWGWQNFMEQHTNMIQITLQITYPPPPPHTHSFVKPPSPICNKLIHDSPLNQSPEKARFITVILILKPLQQAERKLDSLRPRVENILKESKTVTSRDSPGSDTIRHSLLDLSGRWLKACDEVDRNKRAVKIVPNWYQFRSHLEEINNSLKKYEADDRPERYVKVNFRIRIEYRCVP